MLHDSITWVRGLSGLDWCLGLFLTRWYMVLGNVFWMEDVGVFDVAYKRAILLNCGGWLSADILEQICLRQLHRGSNKCCLVNSIACEA